MSHSLVAKEQSIAKIFSDDYMFTIPGYQRPYSWTTEQAGELFDDLISFMQSSSGKLNEMPPYFLGSIVLIKSDGLPDAIVVDGQQRLTTLTVLLSAIRAAIVDVEHKNSITKRIYEQGDVVTATENHYRLSLRDRDREFFRQYVQHEGGIEALGALNDKLTDSQGKIRENARLFLTSLENMGDDIKKLLVQFIVTRCYLVTVATPDLDSAYRIFGVLNSRGLDLSATDILKAEIVGNITAAQRDAYTQKWEDMEEELGRDAFGDLFSHIRMVYRKAKPQGTLLKEFREHVSLKNPTHFIDTVLTPMAEAFQEITDGAYSSQKEAEKINECLHWLNRIEFKDWLPPALVFFSKQRNDPVAMLQFFADLERLAYSMLVRRTSVNGRIERFAALTLAIEKDQDLGDIDSPLQLSPAEQFATYEALSGPLYDTHSARARSIILLRLDALVSGGGASYDFETITVEHVLPQTPQANSNWMLWFPTPQERLHWVHRIGNLALLTRKKNSSANNYEFDKKKQSYFTKGGVSPFALTTQVLQHQNWTLKVVMTRHAELLSKLELHWRLQDRKSPAEVAMDMPSELASSGTSVLFELESTKHNLAATARQVDQKFIVLKGSKAKPAWTGQYHSYQALRQKLIDTQMLKPDGSGNLEFTENTPFDSPSAASATIFGRPDNGRTSWLLSGSSHTYADWQADLLAGTEVTGNRDSEVKQ